MDDKYKNENGTYDLVGSLEDKINGVEFGIEDMMVFANMPLRFCLDDDRIRSILFHLSINIEQHFYKEVYDRPLESVVLIRIIIGRIEYHFKSVKNSGKDFIDQEVKEAVCENLKTVIFRLFFFCPEFKKDSTFYQKEIEGREESIEGNRIKSALPVYYRFEFLKKLGIEDKLGKVELQGDKNAIVCNLVHCNEKTARELRVGRYDSGRSVENDAEFNRLLSLIN